MSEHFIKRFRRKLGELNGLQRKRLCEINEVHIVFGYIRTMVLWSYIDFYNHNWTLGECWILDSGRPDLM